MTQPRHLLSFSGILGGSALLLALAAVGAGCKGTTTSDSSASSDATQAQKEATPPYQTIRRGMIPYSHLITLTGQLEIADVSDNNRIVLKKTKILPNTLVTLNPGEIQFNTTVVSRTPLVRRHVYELRLYPQ